MAPTEPGPAWTVGAVANGHVLTQGAGWVPLNFHVDPYGPRRIGDVIEGLVFTGQEWVPLPGAWRPDPTGRHQFRWWTGRHWTEHAMTYGVRHVDHLAPGMALPSGTPSVGGPTYSSRPSSLGCGGLILGAALLAYPGFWLVVAIYSAVTSARLDEPRYLLLTSTASLNIFLFMLTGKTRGQINKSVVKSLRRNAFFLGLGALAAGVIWVSLHFDQQELLPWTVGVVGLCLIVIWLVR